MSDIDGDSLLFPAAALPVTAAEQATPYRVLARKYRPSTFAELIGQDALVRTLTNAFAQNRIAHAFMLTGVRGVGKTTTARIIARALNCIGPDGKGGPTITPCGTCDNCIAIAADRHVDVMEMDAASRTGIDDIRELIEGVRYAPGAARYKVYIVDEVHMLSKQAFNALLKTLEEPPPHVKFIFATTEIRKVPITVLSRCQRFDLRRIDAEVLIEHFNRIATAETVTVEPDAMALIARAADGSARDGLSLMDQAIARGGGNVTADQVRDMLGLADRAVVLDLFEATMGGQPKEALDILGRLHAAGADPGTIVEDLLDLTHTLTRLKLAPGGARADAEARRGGAMAEKLSMPVLTRTWQLLLKGMGEIQVAPNPHAAAEMIVLRLVYAADLPTPGDLVKQLQGNGAAQPAPSMPSNNGPSGGGRPAMHGGGAATAIARGEPQDMPMHEPMQAGQPMAMAAPMPAAMPGPASYRELVKLFAEKKEGILEYHLAASVRLVRFEAGVVEINPLPTAPSNLANRVGSLLSEWTGRRWVIGISSAPGEPTIAETEQADRDAAMDSARANPAVQALMEAFPGATIVDVRDLATQPPPALDAGAEESGDQTYPADDAGDMFIESGDEL
ncbi:MAG TPA: DNA polymerase III subunit gamma/tau [Alphaproteobacteria bacterium]|nr:DNA polymerase III subunit gamma/tau [Alphaproteobacteria bacterium]